MSEKQEKDRWDVTSKNFSQTNSKGSGPAVKNMNAILAFSTGYGGRDSKSFARTEADISASL